MSWHIHRYGKWQLDSERLTQLTGFRYNVPVQWRQCPRCGKVKVFRIHAWTS